MKLCVVGLGYVGLPAAVVFASRGIPVIGIDIDHRKVEAINRGQTPIKEPGVDTLLRQAVADGKLTATTTHDALRECQAIIIAVNTPVEDGVVNLTQLKNALETAAKNLNKDTLVSIESTVPPGTTEKIAKPILEKSGLKTGRDYYLAHVPERIAPGRAIEELTTAPRLVGGVDPPSTQRAIELYTTINKNLYPTDATTAEFTKLIENTYRDVNIALANIFALMAEKIGIDVWEAIRLANTHPRVHIHLPGPGVGGPCLTKDPYILITAASIEHAKLIQLAREINRQMPTHFTHLVLTALKKHSINPREATVAILGVAYKGGIDDTRETPAQPIIHLLKQHIAEVRAHDPYTQETFGATPTTTVEEALENADAAAIVTDHPQYKQLDWKKLAPLMRHKIIVDGRRVVEPHTAIEAGYTYYAIGYGKPFKI